MSRIGKKPIAIPSGVTVEEKEGVVTVKGPKGSLTFEMRKEVAIRISPEEGLIVDKIGKTKESPALWGTTARILENMIKGVSEGFQKQLELNGVGFRMSVAGNKINFALGF